MGLRPPLLAAALALSACRGEPAEAPAAPETAPAPTPAAPVTPSAPIALAIPDRFHGVWDAEAGSCDPSSDLQIEISAGQIGFYESLGTVAGVTAGVSGPAAIDLRMEGEGESWSITLILALTGAGADERLTAQQRGGDEDLPPPPPLILKRCPA